MIRMNKESYEKLIQEDLEWLAKMPHSLEKMHIEAIVRASIKQNYPEN